MRRCSICRQQTFEHGASGRAKATDTVLLRKFELPSMTWGEYQLRMKTHVSRRLFLGSLLSSASLPVLADAPLTSLRPVLRTKSAPKKATSAEILKDADLTGVTGFMVADVTNGQRIEGLNETALLAPASVAKVLTGLYALDVLGRDFRFKTEVFATGPIDDGVLRGDLVLKGSGDPLLNTDALAKLAQAVLDAGIRRIEGRFIVDGSALKELTFIDPGQPDHVGYNPSISGLNLNFNRVHFEWKKEGSNFSTSMDARSETRRPTVRTSRMRIVDRATPVYGYVDEGTHDSWTVSRQALNSYGSRWLPTRKPRAHVAEVFQALVKETGVVLPNPEIGQRISGSLVASHVSPPLPAVVRGMLKYSTNLTAEVLGLSATFKRSGRRMNLINSAREMNNWAFERFGVMTKMVDHSGLGDRSRVTCAALVELLIEADRQNFDLHELLKIIPMRDAKNKVIKGHPTQVVAKTGTLNFVSALAGYVEGPNGQKKAFAIVSADVPRRSNIPKNDRENPRGAAAWNKRSKRMQQRLLQKWGSKA